MLTLSQCPGLQGPGLRIRGTGRCDAKKRRARRETRVTPGRKNSNLGYKVQLLGAHCYVPVSKTRAGGVSLHPHTLPGHVTHLTASFLKYSFLLYPTPDFLIAPCPLPLHTPLRLPATYIRDSPLALTLNLQGTPGSIWRQF